MRARLSISASPTTWAWRGVLLLALIGCVVVSVRYWRGQRTLTSCIAKTRADCIGTPLRTTRFLDAVAPLEGGGWQLSVDGHPAKTRSPMPGVSVGDRIEARVTLTAPGRLVVHSYVALARSRLVLRLGASILVSFVIFGLVIGRWRRSRSAARAASPEDLV